MWRGGLAGGEAGREGWGEAGGKECLLHFINAREQLTAPGASRCPWLLQLITGAAHLQLGVHITEHQVLPMAVQGHRTRAETVAWEAKSLVQAW